MLGETKTIERKSNFIFFIFLFVIFVIKYVFILFFFILKKAKEALYNIAAKKV